MKEFVFITPVWGSGHIKLFLDIGLPSLLAPDNIPKLSTLCKIKYLIYTKQKDAAVLQNALAIKTLQAIVDVSILIFEDEHPNNHAAMSWCHKEGFKYAVQREGYAVFIPPDCIWSNQAMLAMYNIIKRGYKIIHMSGLRILSDLAYPVLMQSKKGLCLSSRALVKIALKYLHPITLSHFFDEKEGGLMPANLFWTANAGLIARCFHLHPLIVYGTKNKCDFKSTIDDDLALVFNSRAHEEYVVTDSDELIAFEMSPFSHQVLAAYRKGNTNDIVDWAKVSTNAKHRLFIKKAIKIHANGTDALEWAQVEQKSTAVVDTILAELNHQTHNVAQKLWVNVFGKYLKKAVQHYASNISKITELFCRLMRSPEGLYPWHWNYSYQLDVCNPFVDEVKKYSGKILYFDDPYFPLIHDINYSH